jgi:hypothetical protein
MRTTLHVDDDAYRIAARHARVRKIGLGRAVSELIVRGAHAEIPLKSENGLTVFDPPKHLPKLTTEQVKRLSEEW